MSLVFSAIVPHPPLLIPNIGKDELEKISSTKKALEKLEEDLYLSKPDLLIVISPHTSLFSEAFTVNAHTHFDSAFQQFGDFETTQHWAGADFLAAKISHEATLENLPVQLISESNLDHGCTVPLFYLTRHLPQVRVLPIGYCAQDTKTHLRFGELLKNIILNSEKRIAVIASGDLSHALTTEAPAGYAKAGKEFDERIISLLENQNLVGLTNLEPQFIQEAAECGYRSLLILLGILKNINYRFVNYSYEGPFGVGYLVGNFNI
ncbi:MAG TPA: AmmeMemoRadiSam system protein B [Patescibacteria group bacterium]|nr:AmmeMemoRadiSam system protein B [Patescibacteria group bacterium]